jgi:hypothetical protein
MDIKCISNPIDMDIFGIKINGYLDLVIKEENKYNVIYFMMDDEETNNDCYHNILPGLLSVAFYYDFKELNFDIIVYNITNNISYTVKDAGKRMEELFSKTRKILNTSYNCNMCILKSQCTYETKKDNN